MFWKTVFAANILILIRYISLIPRKVEVEQFLVNQYNSVFETNFFNFGINFLYILTALAIGFMIITALAMFEKGFGVKIFNKTLLKILFWSFILPVMLIMSFSCLYNAFISNIWQVSLKNILFVFYNITVLTGCANLAYTENLSDDI